MRIAIVAPQAVPLVLGGAENLWWGLQDHISSETEHSCDLINIPSPEQSFEALISSYETFSKLDLSAYDCVISGKYPAWMVKHPNHICYMLHRLRGLYDTYNPAQHDAAILDHPKIRPLIDWMALGPDPSNPDQDSELFDRLRGMVDAGLPDGATAFPGPLSRAVIHFLDNLALAPHRIQRYGAISGTVAKRQDYFPTDVSVEVLFPPPHRDNYTCGASDYFFTSSRLDGAKRIDMVVKAMKLVKTDIPLLIAGSGPQAEHLKELANGDPRIQFLGYVADEDMPDYYANARAVPFVPADEDYGLVTIEAMRSAKPVITFTDSGGPPELITHDKSGLICQPTIEELAKAMERLAQNPTEAAEMGKVGAEDAKTISWDRVANGLMEKPQRVAPSERQTRPKLTVATVFKAFPPMNGGQARVYHLYRNMARSFDIDLISLGEVDDKYSEKEIAPGLMEITIPKSEAHLEREHDITRQLGGEIPVSDIVSNTLLSLTPAYADALQLSAITSQAVIACHPHMIDIIENAVPDKPLWYEAQDVEINVKSDILGSIPEAGILLDEVRRTESKCWVKAERVFACANRDLIELERLYGPTRAFLHEVPNGVALDNIHYTDYAERQRLKGAAGLKAVQLATFIGSWHGPNLEAVEDILQLAPQNPNTRFLIMGSASLPFKDRAIPANVDLLGAVSMEERDLIFSIADVALNPMRSGSGTNLKMFDYMAAGIPVISTAFGARGIEMTPGTHYIEAEVAGLTSALSELANMRPSDVEALINSAKKETEATYSWHVIADTFVADLMPSIKV